ncbi:MAG: hypothetical protein HQ495_09205 [Alphaproteobacteria bacterium]|nr:hypothetical protein [Alphaproteobacteria bacterium]
MSRLVIDQPPTDLDADIFFQPAFYDLHRGPNSTSHYLSFENDSGKVVGASHFISVGEGRFVSPIRGSYGGFWVERGSTWALLNGFVEEAVDFLSGRGAITLGVTLAPAAYDLTANAYQFAALRSAGFAVSRWEISQHLAVDERPFKNRLRKEKRRHLNKSDRVGQTAQLADRDSYPALYRLLADSRESGGVPLSMSWTQVDQMVKAFPDRVLMVETLREGSPVAAVLAIVVNSAVVYTLYYGAAPEAVDSPVIKALEYLYGWCQAKNYGILDLGASSLDGTVSAPIQSFKQSLGADSSLKFWMEKTL